MNCFKGLQYNMLLDKNEPSRFLGDGVSFKAKLIGILEVSEARGDRMCQEALADLKMAIRAAGEHKQRITINIAIDGLRLRDEKTGVTSRFYGASAPDVKYWMLCCRTRCITILCTKYHSLRKTCPIREHLATYSAPPTRAIDSSG